MKVKNRQTKIQQHLCLGRGYFLEECMRKAPGCWQWYMFFWLEVSPVDTYVTYVNFHLAVPLRFVNFIM